MSEPIYKQIERYLKDLIASDSIRPGELLPTEAQLSEQFHVTRMTVRQAFNSLVKEGFVRRKRGIGSIVLANKIHDNITAITGFTQELRSKGYDVRTHLITLKIISADENIAEALQIETNENVWEIKRVREANNVKVAYMETYMPVKLFPNLNKKDCIKSLYEYIEKQCGYKIESANRHVEAAIANDEIVELLNVENKAPLLYIEQSAYLENGLPFEYAKSYYYGYRLTLKVENF
ncbi:MAG: GntR family transcriptional regulator [Cellulosilyticaceae bacterium]